jgi:hypothetical protein
MNHHCSGAYHYARHGSNFRTNSSGPVAGQLLPTAGTKAQHSKISAILERCGYNSSALLVPYDDFLR